MVNQDIKMNIETLGSFFQNWSKIHLEKESKVKEVNIPNTISMQNFFDKYKPVYQEIELQKKDGSQLNVWLAANLGRNEVRNSKTLRWFLDMYADHGQKNLFLKEFLKCLPEPWCSISTGNYWATEECCPLGNKTERVDIEIDAENFLLFIEVKIDALEGDKQLERYYDTAVQKAKGRAFCIVYLTKDGILPKEHQNKIECMGLSWKTLAFNWQKFVKKELKANPNNRAVWLAEQFIEHISSF